MTFTTLVSVQDLQAHLFDAGWCVVDCRHDLMDFDAGRRAYDEGHIPNAVFARIEDDLSGPRTGRNGRHPLPARERLAATFGAWGICNDTQIVAYDAQDGSFAARLWWLARWMGHERVALLDGGWQAWVAATRWSSTEAPERMPRVFVPGATRVAIASAEQVLAALGQPHALLLDARAPERFEGRLEPLDPVAGHIPGARNRFWQQNFHDGRFKTPAQLRAEFETLLGDAAPAQLINYCGSGITAAHNALALEIAGLPGSALYPGSWSEWVADPTRPVEVGAEPARSRDAG